MKALPESEVTLRSLIEYTSDIITIMNPSGKIFYQSPVMQR